MAQSRRVNATRKKKNETLSRRQLLVLLSSSVGIKWLPSWAAALANIAPQPYFAGVNRALEALTKLGAPVSPADAQQLAALRGQNDSAAIDAAERILDRYTLIRVELASDGYARSIAGGAERTLVEQGWRVFLVRVANAAGNKDTLRAEFGNGQVGKMSSSTFALDQRPDLGITPTNSPNLAPSVEKMWLMGALSEAPPLLSALSGNALEYRVIELFSRDHGRRHADFTLYTNADPFTPYIIQRQHGEVTLEFNALASHNIPLRILDADGRGCMASLILKDKFDRIYPPQAMRLAPDMPFQTQIYRADGESVRLPAGVYSIESKRGPEYLRGVQAVTIGDHGPDRIDIQLKRWVDPATYGWYSGDTHIHAAGCLHYNKPTEGVTPETIIRHVRGEGLAIGDILTWGPDYYYQKQFFTGRAESPAATLEHPELQAANQVDWQPHASAKDSESLIRYDVEISGFPSSHAGHLVLLRLKDQDYPGTKLVEDWPSWNLPILKWTKAQGGVAGYAHCGLGMLGDSTELPNYDIPPFDSVGANEAIVDVTHDAVDFLSGCEILPAAELNAWYHLLNCGFRPSFLGETDYPCWPNNDERPGVGRSYVRLDHRPVDDGGYDAWVQSAQQGRLYFGDGRSHFLKFTVDRHANGEEDVLLRVPRTVDVRATIAAWLEPEPTAETKGIQASYPYFPPGAWHLERARIGATRAVAVELIVNGVGVNRVSTLADGQPRAVHFTTDIGRSSWVALRILPSGHTYPVFVQVGRKPIRASKRSAQWCRTCVDKLWEVKSPFMRQSERTAASEAFDHARSTYDTIINESQVP